jgi:uncharacterized membrane protein
MNKIRAITYALLAAVFYAVNVPLSKILLDHVGPTTMAALLYLGAGLGIGLLSLLRRGDRQRSEKLDRKDLPYVRAQNVLGAAKTSAYYAAAPFVGAFLSFVILRERLSWTYFAALAVMAAGSALVVADTLIRHHEHLHQHVFTHTHDGSTHTQTVTHAHVHDHYLTDGKHGHRHTAAELEKLPGAVH